MLHLSGTPYTSKLGPIWTWQQDGASPHSAYTSMMYILQNVPRFLPWTAHSPDLSPIEQDALKLENVSIHIG